MSVETVPWWYGVRACIEGTLGALESFDGDVAAIRLEDGTVRVGRLDGIHV